MITTLVFSFVYACCYISYETSVHYTAAYHFYLLPEEADYLVALTKYLLPNTYYSILTT